MLPLMQPVLDKLVKVLELEHRQGCGDRAVIGGLGAFLANWRSEASGALPAEVVASLIGPLDGYAAQPPDARRASVADVLDRARGVDLTPAPDGQVPGAPEDTVPAVPKDTVLAISEDTAPAAPEDAAPAGAGDADLDRPVTELRGIGRKVAENLRPLGIATIRDMLYHAPSRYKDFSQLRRINQLRPGEETTIVGTVWDVRNRRLPNGRHLLTVILSDTTATVGCSFFNQPYLEREFQQGEQVVVSGKVEVWAGRLVFRSPEWEPLSHDLIHTARLVPVYPLTAGVTGRWLRRQIKGVVDGWAGRVADPLPAAWRARAEVPRLPEALRAVHFPKDEVELEAARRRLAFDELLLLQLWLRRRRRAAQSRPGIDLAAGRELQARLIEHLPFALTDAQKRVIEEIDADLARPVPMSRLLQGDVGCGKTAVAAAAMAMAVGAGCQAAMMAPTEILAEQHFQNLWRMLEPLGFQVFDRSAPAEAPGPRIARLVGSMRASEKAATAAAIQAGEVDVVVGTHAVIQGTVRFARLGLAIVDEQHRFGVLQRAELPQKGVPAAGAGDGDDADAGDEGDVGAAKDIGPAGDTRDSVDTAGAASAPVPHVLIMTATPIPRTLAQVLNADLDQSVIDALPPGRKPVKTVWLQPSERERGYQYIRHRVRQGEQAYIVCPLVEDSEAIQSRAAVAEYERLGAEVLPDLRLGLLHGKMRPAEKEAVMADFKAGNVDVLVSTSVIEVGVDVPNATVMLIDGADRFGLAQLHQFRGRVGRGSVESVCLLLADDPSEGAAARLALMAETDNGLALAERDLETRGPGDYFGVRQSGNLDNFRFARLAPGAALTLAQRIAGEMMAEDPDLEQPELAAIRARVEAFRVAAARA